MTGSETDKLQITCLSATH